MDVGSTIGRYLIEERIGQGGMGVVHRARHQILGSLHAMKMVTVHHPDAQERLLREAKAQARLSHPNIVSVTDVLDWQGQLVIVMEYVPGGETLHDLVQRSRLDIATVERLGHDILEALRTAHACGLVHRDIKPSNILIQRIHGRPVPKVADFGLVRFDDAEAGPRLTATGLAMGTPGYASPEQLRGHAIDRRSDIFSLGATLYELCTGQPAFPGRDVMEICQATCAGEYVAPRRHRPDLPEGLCEALRLALEISLTARAESVDQLLAAWTGQAPVTTAPAHPGLDQLLAAAPDSDEARHLAGCVSCRIDVKRYRRDMGEESGAPPEAQDARERGRHAPATTPLDLDDAPPPPADDVALDERTSDRGMPASGTTWSWRHGLGVALVMLAVVWMSGGRGPADGPATVDAVEQDTVNELARKQPAPTPQTAAVPAAPVEASATPRPVATAEESRPEVPREPEPVRVQPVPTPVPARTSAERVVEPAPAEEAAASQEQPASSDEGADRPVGSAESSEAATVHKVTLGSVPFGAAVVVDGEALGTAPLRDIALAPGMHTVQMTLEGVTATKQFVAGDDEPVRYIWEVRADSWRVFYE